VSEMSEANKKVIEEFRANAGKVGGYFEQMPLVLLHTTGAKSGSERINPLAYLRDDDRIFVFASYGGAPHHPDWYWNLKAHPDVTVEVGTESYQATATEITGEERDRLYAEQGGRLPQFAEYQQKTARRIPVIALERR
jgi:deazaflavin-dependent oxidoreductase (nitroreductase family)